MTDSMKSRVGDLASLIRDRSVRGRNKFILLLGAGASMGSSVPTTELIISELLDKYGKRFQDSSKSVVEQFNEMWKKHADDRQEWLNPYLERTPSAGYTKLAELIKKGFFDTVITFNFDTLLELALDDIGFTDYQVLVGGTEKDDKLLNKIQRKRKRVSILHVHGCLAEPDNLQFAEDEIYDYSEGMKETLRDLTKRSIIICGYSFQDLNVQTEFAKFGEPLWCVNPAGAPKFLRSYLRKRDSRENEISDKLGYFDKFFDALHKMLTNPGVSGVVFPTGENRFKFLAGHTEKDNENFGGREEDTEKLLDILQSKKPKAMFIFGPQLAGKTSLVRAGIIPRLSSEQFFPVYIRRCSAELEHRLAIKMRTAANLDPDIKSLGDALAKLVKKKPDKHVVLFLDQFERAVQALGKLDEATSDKILELLLNHDHSNLTVIAVSDATTEFRDQPLSFYVMAKDITLTYVKAFSEQDVIKLLHAQAEGGGLPLRGKLIENLAAKCAEKDNSFTLAHAQTVCHLVTMKILQGGGEDDFSTLEGTTFRKSLDWALLEYNVMTLLDDLPIREGQALLRHVLREASDESKQAIIKYLDEHYREILDDKTLYEGHAPITH